MTTPADVLIVAAPRDPERIAEARRAADLTQAEAAEAAGLGAGSRWSEIESGRVGISAARWTLFLLATGQHPTLRLVLRRRRFA